MTSKRLPKKIKKISKKPIRKGRPDPRKHKIIKKHHKRTTPPRPTQKQQEVRGIPGILPTAEASVAGSMVKGGQKVLKRWFSITRRPKKSKTRSKGVPEASLSSSPFDEGKSFSIGDYRDAGMLGQYGLHAKAATVATGGLAATGAASYGLPEAEAKAPYVLKTIWYNATTLAKAKKEGMSPSLIAKFKKNKRLHVVVPEKQGDLGIQEFTTGGFTGPTSGQYTGMPKSMSGMVPTKRTLQAKFSSHHRVITHKSRVPETQWIPYSGPSKGKKIDVEGKAWLEQKMWIPISGRAEAATGPASTKRGVDKNIVKGVYVNLTDAEKGKMSAIARAEQAYKTGRYKPKKADKPMSEARAKKLKAAGIQTQYVPYSTVQGNVSAMARHGVVRIKMPDGTVRFFGSHEAAIKAYNKASKVE